MTNYIKVNKLFYNIYIYINKRYVYINDNNDSFCMYYY